MDNIRNQNFDPEMYFTKDFLNKFQTYKDMFDNCISTEELHYDKKLLQKKEDKDCKNIFALCYCLSKEQQTYLKDDIIAELDDNVNKGSINKDQLKHYYEVLNFLNFQYDESKPDFLQEHIKKLIINLSVQDTLEGSIKFLKCAHIQEDYFIINCSKQFIEESIRINLNKRIDNLIYNQNKREGRFFISFILEIFDMYLKIDRCNLALRDACIVDSIRKEYDIDKYSIINNMISKICMGDKFYKEQFYKTHEYENADDKTLVEKTMRIIIKYYRD